jgi:predicted ATPase
MKSRDQIPYYAPDGTSLGFRTLDPFFTIQFLSALAEEGLLRFDRNLGARWIWELDRIRARDYSTNVADLMVVKLRVFLPAS